MTMRIYLAARYDRRSEMDTVWRPALEAAGHTVTSRWVRGAHDASGEGVNREQYACEDLTDVDLADVLVFFSEQPSVGYTKGGRHVEMGYALGRGKRVFVVGSRENVFHWLPYTAVVMVDNLQGLLFALSGLTCDDVLAAVRFMKQHQRPVDKDGMVSFPSETAAWSGLEDGVAVAPC